ncbi:MAG: hypothetical protein CMJ40_09525 [Phycisphaerae bacterium]|nr:hypothetical protein [Phycisphaerae bacterium]|tara:strand:+ start:403 stop:1359 length:957 start_codon:yes stop_codon:yes gene_type:complete
MSDSGGAGHGLDVHRHELDPALVSRVEAWRNRPELSGLYDRLCGQQQRRPFMDAWAEVIIADRLDQMGCDLEVEVPTPRGRTCDLRVRRDGREFHVHIKRFHDARKSRRIRISPRLRVLEGIERPWLVRVRWTDGLSDEEMQELVVRCSEFLLQARVGDELTVRSTDGRELGGIRVVAPWDSRTVSLAIGLPEGFQERGQKIRRLMERASQQFMPKSDNVILIATPYADDLADFDAALLGSNVERWDPTQPPGQRMKWDRADDGFWHGTSRDSSRAMGWFRFRPSVDQLNCTLRFREQCRPALRSLLLACLATDPESE